jgi:hypothetical protein
MNKDRAAPNKPKYPAAYHISDSSSASAANTSWSPRLAATSTFDKIIEVIPTRQVPEVGVRRQRKQEGGTQREESQDVEVRRKDQNSRDQHSEASRSQKSEVSQ